MDQKKEKEGKLYQEVVKHNKIILKNTARLLFLHCICFAKSLTGGHNRKMIEPWYLSKILTSSDKSSIGPGKDFQPGHLAVVTGRQEGI